MKKLLKSLPLASFIIAIGFAASSFAFTQDTIWVYEDNGDQTVMPQCIEDPEVCATEYFVDSQGNLLSPTGNQKFGIRND